jgi:precorrin-3B C17-methyltransferase
MAGGKLFIVGTGPGATGLMSMQAMAAVAGADVVVGYRGYLEQISGLTDGKRLVPGTLGQELERAAQAIELAVAGATVALVSSGDAGVYGMASPTLEVLERRQAARQPVPDVMVVPGISAALAAAALLGAPLGADFAVISLSDLLTPWERIERRVALAAEADFALAFYNPVSQRRNWQLPRARELILRHRQLLTPVGLVRQAYRAEQEVVITDLSSLLDHQLDMTTIVIVGNSTTRRFGNLLVTPRGYLSDPRAPAER